MADQPKRIQRRRTKGWKMPAGAIYVGRPTKWGNPFTVACYGSAEKAVELFRRELCDEGRYFANDSASLAGRYTTLNDVRQQLRGKDLACWCPLDQPCHADVLLELANQ